MTPKHAEMCMIPDYPLTMERSELVLDVKVSPLAQSTPKRAQISPE